MRRHRWVILAIAATLSTIALGATLASALAPVVSVEDAANVGYTTAEVKGTVDPGGLETSYHFEYATQAQFEASGWAEASWAGFGGFSQEEADGISGPTPVTPATLESLAPGATYHLRLVAANADGSESAVASTFETKAVALPSVTINPVAGVTATTASFSGTVTPNAPGEAPQDPAFDTTWRFICVPACTVGTAGGKALADDDAKAVASDATNLQPNTTYTVKLSATSLGGKAEASEIAGEPVTFKTTALAPTAKTNSASSSSPSTAELNGFVNPHNSPTAYWFEWGTSDCSANPCAAIPLNKDADAGSGSETVFVSRPLSGLSPGTVYHYRLLADNGVGAPVAGADRTFVTAAADPGCTNAGAPGAGFLPNCRAWEMVSSRDKNGGYVSSMSSRTRAAADGNALSYLALSAFEDAHGLHIGTEYIARRTAAPGTSGWATHGITPEQLPLGYLGAYNGQDSLYEAEMSSDLSRGVFRSFRLLPGTDAPHVAPVQNLYTRTDLLTPGAGAFELISNAPFQLPTPFNRSFTGLNVAGTSTDFSHVLFESRQNLTTDTIEPTDLGEEGKLYESVDGVPRLAGRIPVSGSECDDVNGPACEPAKSSQAGTGVLARGNLANMISADGSRVFFQSPSDGGGSKGDIYMRVNGTRTVKLNAPEKAAPESPQFGSLLAANPAGTQVYFSTAENLVEEDTDPGSNDLYRYDVGAPAGDRLTMLSPDGEPADDNFLMDVIGFSDDGDYVYFLAGGQYVADEPLFGNTAGIYLWHQGTLTFIGYFSEQTADDVNGIQSAWHFATASKASRVTPDGRYLLFVTESDEGFAGRGGFPGYDHGDNCSGGGTDKEPCREFYLYDAESGTLRCASCNPAGIEPADNAINYAQANASNTRATAHLSRALSEDGRYAFFSTGEGLLPEDTNGKVDAYVYDSRSEEVRLISSGTSPDDSYFLEASADGRNVFFSTAEALSGWDEDTAIDVYVARVGGGLPEPPPTPAPCGGDSCRGAAPPAPSPVAATSASFAGAGDPKPRRGCPKGTRKRTAKNGKVRCVKPAKNRPKRTAKNDRRAAK